MDYELKYYKYKSKYIKLKNKISGGKLPETQKYKIIRIDFKNNYELIVRETIGNDLVFHGYGILINKDIRTNDKIDVCLMYSSDIINEIKIYINNLDVEIKKRGYSIKLDEVNDFNNITIKYNNGDIDNYENIGINNKIKKLLLNLNKEKSKFRNIYDECQYHVNSLEKNKDIRIDKLVSIMACTKMRNKFNDEKSLKYVNLMKFLHNIIYLGILNSDKDKLTKYANQLIKLSIPIYVPSNSIQIQTGTGLIELSGDYKVEVDSGNSFYTLISNKFYELIKDNSEKADVCLRTIGIGNGKLECKELVKFKIKIYGKEFNILSTIDNNSNDVDILFGSKGGIDLFFKNGMAIDSCSEDNLLIKHSSTYIRNLDLLVIKLYNKFINNKNITSKNIDKFIIKYMKELLGYNKNISRDISCNLTNISNDYYEVISDNKDVGKIINNIMEKYNMAHPINVNKNYCFDNEDSKFIDNHFLALKYSNLIKTNNDKLKFKSFEELLMTIVR